MLLKLRNSKASYCSLNGQAHVAFHQIPLPHLDNLDIAFNIIDGDNKSMKLMIKIAL